MEFNLPKTNQLRRAEYRGYLQQDDEYEHHEAVTQRALVVINDSQEIVYTWTADDSRAEFDISIFNDLRKNVDVFPSQDRH